ncbi:hypothetical protein [Planomonospora sp. ID82291]|uniref:hypothetical protein n=1 Tax=Planomonospora sp. ID82291 TaxID=2738136 RepID=UPI0018C3F900|nr:hypothetical protein [Planomonospora sp. ID82291]MBG0818558.1 hypothetical protein [Planomonospora sp. ID82291]
MIRRALVITGTVAALGLAGQSAALADNDHPYPYGGYGYGPGWGSSWYYSNYQFAGPYGASSNYLYSYAW